MAGHLEDSINQIIKENKDLNINTMSVEDFKKIKHMSEIIEGSQAASIGPFTSLIIVPSGGDEELLHDSGFRCMSFVVCEYNTPIVRLAGYSDVIHIEGIGGYNILNDKHLKALPPGGWSIDCLSKSGLLRLFCSTGLYVDSLGVSSFTVYSSRTKRI